MPPGVLTSSTAGVRGAEIAFESLLGTPADFIRRCEIPADRIPEESGVGTAVCANSGAVIDSIEMGVDGLRVCDGSVGVGGVTTVAGPLNPGGVEGSWVINERGVLVFRGEGVFSPGSSKSAWSPNTIGIGGTGGTGLLPRPLS